MSRSTSIMGLPPAAVQFVKTHGADREEVCHLCGCGKIKTASIWPHKDASDLGMFDDGPILLAYELKDGSVVVEEEQLTVWSSGPNIFLKLCTSEGEELFTWSEEEMEERT